MAAYHRVYDLRHLQADCQEPGLAPEPYAWQSSMGYLYIFYRSLVSMLVQATTQFRVVALSATPGSDIKSVQQVLTNLLISHIELRTDDCADIRPYTHERRVDKVVVPLGDELASARDTYLRFVDAVVSRLKQVTRPYLKI